MERRLGEDGIKEYTNMLLITICIYIIGSMQANEGLPKLLKHFTFEEKKGRIANYQDNQKRDDSAMISKLDFTHTLIRDGIFVSTSG